MDIPQAAIAAAGEAIHIATCEFDLDECVSEGVHDRAAREALEAAYPYLGGTCALHGGLDQAVILRALSDPGSVVERGEGDTVSMWQTRAVVASLTASLADPAIPTGGTT
jgi:hypothetical protein